MGYNGVGPYGYVFYGNSGTTAASIARANAATTITFRVQDTNLFRDARGWYTSVQQEIDRLNRTMARNIQQGVVNETYGTLLRPSVKTNRLRKAYLGPKQIQPAPGGFQYGVGVFDPVLLDQSEAKYWRLIEYGTKEVLGGRWTGRMVDSQGIPLFGRWGGTIKGYYTNRWGRVPSAGPPWNVEGGKLKVAPQSIREAMVRNSTGKAPKAPYRRKHIVPANAIAHNWEKYGSDKAAARILNAIRKEMAQR